MVCSAFSSSLLGTQSQQNRPGNLRRLRRTDLQDQQAILRPPTEAGQIPVKSLVKADKLDQASQRFAKAATALEKAERQLGAVPQPSADETKLRKWLVGIKGEVGMMRTIAAKLGQGNKAKASSMSVKLTHNATRTNNLVTAFQFDYCRIDPPRYT
jgi:hypothetical protein